MAMEVILQQDVDNLGHMGDVVRVRPGYARNFLLPRGLAVVADHKNLAQLEHQKRGVAARRAKAEAAAKEGARKLDGVVVRIEARAGGEDRLFGSVTNQDVQRALAAQGVEVDRKKILLDAPIKTLGTFDVAVSLGVGVKGTVKVEVVRDAESAAAVEAAAKEAAKAPEESSAD